MRGGCSYITFSTQLSALAANSTVYIWLISFSADPAYTSGIFVHGPLHSRFHYVGTNLAFSVLTATFKAL